MRITVVATAISSVSAVRAAIGISAIPICVGFYSRWRRIRFEVLKVDANVSKQIFTQFFRFLNLGGLGSCNVQVHRFVRLLAGAVFHKS